MLNDEIGHEMKQEKPFNWKRNVALFMAGQGLTLFGSMLVHYAVMWHIALATQSGLMMTLISITGTLPIVFISPFAGVWADRFNKKHLINLSDAIVALFTLAMAALFSFEIEMTGFLLVCLVMRALGQGVQGPTVTALVPELAPPESLDRVNGINGSIQSLVMFASPLAGGAMLAFAPIQSLLFIDVITAAIGISILQFFVKTPDRAQERESQPNASQYFKEIGEGIKYVGSHPFLRKALLLSALFNFLMVPSASLTPLQVARRWGDDIWRIFGGVLFGPEQRLAAAEVLFFIGMMLGGLVLFYWGGFKNRSHTIGLSIALQSIGIVGLGLSSNFWLFIVCMLYVGLFINLFNPSIMTMLQLNIDSAYMGRVFSVMAMIGSLMSPLGMVLWGPLSDRITADWIFISTGIINALLSSLFFFDRTMLEAGFTQPVPSPSGEESGSD